MTGTTPELLFAGFFLLFMSINRINVFVPEQQSLAVARTIVRSFGRAAAWCRPPRVEGRTTSQPEPVIPVRRQPVVRLLP